MQQEIIVVVEQQFTAYNQKDAVSWAANISDFNNNSALDIAL